MGPLSSFKQKWSSPGHTYQSLQSSSCSGGFGSTSAVALTNCLWIAPSWDPPFCHCLSTNVFLWQLFADIAGCLLLQWLKTGLLCILRWSLGFREFSPSATLPTHCAKDNYMHSFADCIKIITMKDSENCTLQGEIRKSFGDRQCSPQSEGNTITITCITCTQFKRSFDNKWPYYSISILSFPSSPFALMFSFGFCFPPLLL